MIRAKSNSSGILTKSGHIYIWGTNLYALNYIEYGKFDVTTPKLIPYVKFTNNVIGILSNIPKNNIIDISLGEYHSGVLTKDGMVYIWGKNEFSQLGLGDTHFRSTPTLIPQSSFKNEKIISLELGYETSGCITESYKLYLWGNNNAGRLGTGDDTTREFPTLLHPSKFNGGKILTIRLCRDHSGAITESGQLYMWGYNGFGQLGDGTHIDKNIPTLIPQSIFENEKIIHLTIGEFNSGIITESGKVYLWGNNSFGQIGDGTTILRSTPTLIHPSYFNNEKVIALSLGSSHSGAITESGKLYMWGFNKFGQLGLNTDNNEYIPKLVPPSYFNNEPIIELAIGDDHTLVLTSSNKLYATGHNAHGQLGLGDTNYRKKFEFVVDINNL